MSIQVETDMTYLYTVLYYFAARKCWWILALKVGENWNLLPHISHTESSLHVLILAEAILWGS